MRKTTRYNQPRPLRPPKTPKVSSADMRTAISESYRHFASDRPTEHALVTLKEWLDGKIASGDVVSISLLARRAISLYHSHCVALNQAGNLDVEREEVRRNSRMPSKNPRKNNPYRRARKPKKTLEETTEGHSSNPSTITPAVVANKPHSNRPIVLSLQPETVLAAYRGGSTTTWRSDLAS